MVLQDGTSGKKITETRTTTTTSRTCLYIVLPVCTAVLVWYFISPSESQVCHKDYFNNGAVICKLRCPERCFSLPWMDSCAPWLTNRDVESTDFKVIRHIGNGAVKMVYLAEWKGYKVVLNTLLNPKYQADFQHGMNMLIALQGHPFVTQFVGRCKNGYLTEYHQAGSAEGLSELLNDSLRKHNTVAHMMSLCVQYANIIDFLHTSPIGTRVMCDSNDLQKTLNQYLLRDDLRLILNDLDALPEVNQSAGRLIKCGHRLILGEFVAPEQLWPFDDREFSDDEMPGYDEKTDIWKMPKVCEHFLSQAPGHDALLFHLFKIHKQCQSQDPSDRPTAAEVLRYYQEVLKEL